MKIVYKSDKKVIPVHVYIGDPIWKKIGNKYYDVNNEEIEVITLSLEELIEKMKEIDKVSKK